MNEKLAEPFELNFVEAQKLGPHLPESLGLVALLRPYLQHPQGPREYRVQSVPVSLGHAMRGRVALRGARQHGVLIGGGEGGKGKKGRVGILFR